VPALVAEEPACVGSIELEERGQLESDQSAQPSIPLCPLVTPPAHGAARWCIDKVPVHTSSYATERIDLFRPKSELSLN
jgi:hypothetical protein